MKKKGASSDFTAQRDEELYKVFVEVERECAHIRLNEALEKTVKHPCSRFWVSAERAARVLRAMFLGQRPTAGMSEMKRAMYEELFVRAKRIRETFPTMSIERVAYKAVLQQAPQFYISAQAAGVYLHYVRKKKRRKK